MKTDCKITQPSTISMLRPVRARPNRDWMVMVKCGWLNVFQTAAVFFATFLIFSGCSKPAEKPADAPEKAEAKPGVTVDAETQTRIGLEMASPVAMRRQPELHAMGRVVDPLAFTQAAAEYEMARTAAVVSQSDFERTQKLAAQDNASPRVVEAAQAAAGRDALALNSARAKFTAEWGVHLAAQTNLLAFAEKLQTTEIALVKLSLASGIFPHPLPDSASLLDFDGETKPAVAAEFADDCGIDPATQAQTLLFSVNQKLPRSLAVMGQLKTSGEPVNGVLIPATAVLRHEGKGWVYVQTETNQFARVEVSLEGQTDAGWFVRENLSATNRVVVTGAQTLLSAELGGSGLNTGAHD